MKNGWYVREEKIMATTEKDENDHFRTRREKL